MGGVARNASSQALCQPLTSRRFESSSVWEDSACGAASVWSCWVTLGEAPHRLPIAFMPTCTGYKNVPKGRNGRADLLTVVWAADKGFTNTNGQTGRPDS